jgi:putative transposase
MEMDVGGGNAMPQRSVPFLPDHYYHFYNRGINREAIFFERENYLFFLRGLKKYLGQYLEILAYCLMPNHYHILVRVRSWISQAITCQKSEVEEDFGCFKNLDVSRAMQKFLISYTKAINKRYGRVGPLFQGQFQAKLIESDAHLLQVCAYIHANPVKAGLVLRPEEWEFSNYLEWMNLRNGSLFNPKFVDELFGSCKEYRNYLMDTIEAGKIPEEMRTFED